MIMALLDALALVWIMAREQEDPEDGEERIYTSSVASDHFPLAISFSSILSSSIDN